MNEYKKSDSSDAVISELNHLKVDYEIMPCDPDLADTASFCENYGISPEDSANAILVVGKSDPKIFTLCLLLATHKLDVNGAIRKKLGTKKASFASGEETENITGMIVGGVTPFGLPSPLLIWVDKAVMERASVIVGGGSRDQKIRINPSTLLSLTNVEIIENLAKLPEPS
jgi:prolyl-tRNA editing enzyme YbaK/EbsC (Cys-tRNA(Pro) deacylase)